MYWWLISLTEKEAKLLKKCHQSWTFYWHFTYQPRLQVWTVHVSSVKTISNLHTIYCLLKVTKEKACHLSRKSGSGASINLNKCVLTTWGDSTRRHTRYYQLRHLLHTHNSELHVTSTKFLYSGPLIFLTAFVTNHVVYFLLRRWVWAPNCTTSFITYGSTRLRLESYSEWCKPCGNEAGSVHLQSWQW